jgi:hypothetical protein
MTGDDGETGVAGAAGFSNAETEVPGSVALRGVFEVTDWAWP